MDNGEKLIGQQLGDYVVLRLLAHGGMAEVYVAQQDVFQREDVLKVMLPHFAQDQKFVERFGREAKAMSDLHHPNIVEVYTTGMTPEMMPYIAMQYAPEGTLAQRLAEVEKQEAYFTTGYALAIARQMASALAEAHRQGIIHRDVKPSNILLQTDTKPLLTDLGIAYMTNNPRLTRTNVLMGTPDYMSPEQAKNQDLDGRSDIFSLGIILYEMLTGIRPFAADSPWTTIHLLMNNQPEAVSALRPDLCKKTVQIVQKSMEKKPEKRYQNANEMVAAIDAALAEAGEETAVSTDGLWIWKPQTGTFVKPRQDVAEAITAVKKQRTLLKSAAFGLLGVAAILVFFLASRVILPPVNMETPAPETAIAMIVETPTAEATSTRSVPPTSTLNKKTPVQPVNYVDDTDVSSTEEAEDAVAALEEVETPVAATTTMAASPTLAPTTAATELSPGPSLPLANITTNVRALRGPDTAFNTLAFIEGGETVTVVASSDHFQNWFLVQQANGGQGWIGSKYLVFVNESLRATIPVATNIPTVPTDTPIPRPTVPPPSVEPTPDTGSGGGGGSGGSKPEKRPTVAKPPTPAK